MIYKSLGRTRRAALQTCAILVSALILGGCGRGLEPTLAGTKNGKFTGTAYISAGEDFTLIVDVQAARIAERQEFLPLHIAYLNKSDKRTLVRRESFILETTDGSTLPVVGYREFTKSYPRHRVDLRVARNFIESLNGRYPSPPFRRRGLEFFPLRESGDVPRDEIELSPGDLGVGFIYFRLPDDGLLDDLGGSRLLFTPTGDGANGEQFVIELQVYRAKSKS